MNLPKDYKRRITVGVFLICLTALFLYWQSKEFLADMARGSKSLLMKYALPITYEMMDSVSVGLEKSIAIISDITQMLVGNNFLDLYKTISCQYPTFTFTQILLIKIMIQSWYEKRLVINLSMRHTHTLMLELERRNSS